MTRSELIAHYAGLAMQGMLAHHGCYDEGRGNEDSYHCDDMAKASVVYAVALADTVYRHMGESGEERPLK